MSHLKDSHYEEKKRHFNLKKWNTAQDVTSEVQELLLNWKNAEFALKIIVRGGRIQWDDA